jgi:hypothetical protein
MDELNEHKPGGKAAEYIRGILVLVVLGILTALEYWLGAGKHGALPVFSAPTIPLIMIALIKAGLIVNYYMHISRMWGAEGEEF